MNFITMDGNGSNFIPNIQNHSGPVYASYRRLEGVSNPNYWSLFVIVANTEDRQSSRYQLRL